MTTAVILAAGRGTRLRPLTDQVPKALIPIGEKPVAEYLVDDLIAAGVTQIVFIVGHLSDLVSQHFETRRVQGVTFRYVKQTVLNGTGGALQLAERFVSGQFIVVFGDGFYTGDSVRQMLMAEWANAIAVVRVEDPRRFGVVEVSPENRIVDVVEKPETPRSNLVVAGMYKLQSNAWKYIRGLQPSPRGELEIPDVIRMMVADGHAIGAVEIDPMLDVGTPEELVRARKLVAAQASQLTID